MEFTGAVRESGREVFNSYNSLLCVAQAVTGFYTTIDLRNDSFISGKIEQVDGFMNIVISDALFTDACGNEFYYDPFFVKERNIRYIHLPEEISIPDVIERKLNPIRIKPKRKLPTSFKGKKLMSRQLETLARVKQIKLERQNKKAESMKEKESET
ncbi:U7 snRNA-associated Sm-like protein LSm10 isoform X2 [Halyomorpha halys]|uniref:U7 snRNA-associated Sm-like protein LSm10 isoform X2 n=1 Tax=Halyomorpha halys TaxID=286706 RepID=UPI000D0C82DD|nr:U7 snRNA-associated Sm-like protein LSm10 [Halyomorpha halys]